MILRANKAIPRRMVLHALNLPGDRDLLTGLVGPVEARAWLNGACARGMVHAMLIGLQRLQSVNIAYGKTGGDQVLVEVARRIDDFALAELGAQAFVARLGGGEFLLASDQPVTRERWQYLAEALGQVIGRPVRVDGEDLHLALRTVLVDAQHGQSQAGADQNGEEGAALLDRLDQAALILQRTAGRRVLWADGTHAVLGRSAALLEGDLLGAIHREEIAVLFQPQFSVSDETLAGAEALARWDHPQFGQICAETLFAVADRGDHMAQLSRHIARRALTLGANWPEPLRLSLNVTAEDFALGDWGSSMQQMLAETGFPPERLTLEITEQTLISDFEACSRALLDLTALGVQVALDDFGTGFSNFRALKALPLDALKLDRSLIKDIATDKRDHAILSAMIALARALGLKVVAEGVESEAQLATLKAAGCDIYQGFLRAEAIDPNEFARLAAA